MDIKPEQRYIIETEVEGRKYSFNITAETPEAAKAIVIRELEIVIRELKASKA